MQIEEQMILVLVEDLRIPRDQFTRDSHLVADLGFDSLAYRIVQSAFEARLGTRLPDEQVRACETLGSLIEFAQTTLR
ncbi:acyl carrier protein [Nocardia sp. NPDC058666]|uniref:acyl carrier protein n=1 Tax=unclassified Nocardia TaxID=2637762 RepID=UPI00366237A5